MQGNAFTSAYKNGHKNNGDSNITNGNKHHTQSSTHARRRKKEREKVSSKQKQKPKKENKNKMEMYPRIRYSFTFVYIFNALALGMKHYPVISVAYYALFSSAFALALKWMRNLIQHGYHTIRKPYRVGGRKTPLYYFNSNWSTGLNKMP